MHFSIVEGGYGHKTASTHDSWDRIHGTSVRLAVRQFDAPTIVPQSHCQKNDRDLAYILRCLWRYITLTRWYLCDCPTILFVP